MVDCPVQRACYAGLLAAAALAPWACVQGQDAAPVSAVAREILQGQRCGSTVLRTCLRPAAQDPPAAWAPGPRRIAPREFEEVRRAMADDLYELLISGERIRDPSATALLAQRLGQGDPEGVVRSVFERNLGAGDERAGRAMETTDWGGGVRCTVTVYGGELCTDPVNVTPGRVLP